MNFKTWLEEIVPMGDCFRYATKLAVEMLTDGVIPERGIKVVHAIVHPKWHEREYPHAWVEAQGRAYDWQMKNTVGSLSVKDFYKEYQPDKARMKKYTPARAVGFAVKTKHYGPWEI